MILKFQSNKCSRKIINLFIVRFYSLFYYETWSSIVLYTMYKILILNTHTFSTASEPGLLDVVGEWFSLFRRRQSFSMLYMAYPFIYSLTDSTAKQSN